MINIIDFTAIDCVYVYDKSQFCWTCNFCGFVSTAYLLVQQLVQNTATYIIIVLFSWVNYHENVLLLRRSFFGARFFTGICTWANEGGWVTLFIRTCRLNNNAVGDTLHHTAAEANAQLDQAHPNNV